MPTRNPKLIAEAPYLTSSALEQEDFKLKLRRLLRSEVKAQRLRLLI